MRNCDLEVADEAEMDGPVRATTLSRTVGRSPARSTSIVTVTAVSEVLACCPPGPLDRETRSSTSDRGKSTDRVTRRWVRSSCALTIVGAA